MQKLAMAASALLLLGCGGSSPTTSPSPAPSATPTSTGSPSPGPAGSRIDPASVTLFARGEYYIGAGAHLGSRRDFGYEAGPSREALTRLNLNSFRDDVFWQAFAPRGDADPGSLLPKLADVLATAPQRPLLVLNGGHTMIANADPPIDENSRAAFARFASRAVTATRGRNPIYEVWNEWNRSADTEAAAFDDEGPPADPRFAGNYAALAKAVVPAIRAADPGATILVGGAATDWKWNWLMGVVRRGGLEGADGLSVHLYNQCYSDRRGAPEMIARLDALQQQVRALNQGRDVAIYVTEWGWSTGRGCRVSNDFVIANSAQFMFAAAARPWVRGTWQYVLKDTGQDSGVMFDNFGVLAFDYSDKPTACATRETAALLRSVRSIGAAQQVAGVQVIFATTANGNVAIAWDTAGSYKALVIDRQSGVTVTPICGAGRSLGEDRRVPLSAVPVVIGFGSTWQAMTILGN